MKLVVTIFMVMGVMCNLALAGTRDISSPEARALLEKNKNIFLLDVRTPQENSQARIAGTVLIPIGELERRIGEVPKNKPVLIYCAVGSRSRAASDLLSHRGYKDVYNMNDGIVGWYRNGFPLQR